MAAKEKTNVDIKQGKCCRLWEPSKGIKHFFKINCGQKDLFYQVKVSYRGLQKLEPVLEGLGQPQPVLEGLGQLQPVLEGLWQPLPVLEGPGQPQPVLYQQLWLFLALQRLLGDWLGRFVILMTFP